MVSYDAICENLEKIAPLSLAMDWDNSGFQILLKKDNFKKIGICLDITQKTIERAIKEGIDLLIAHHPMYFVPQKNIITGNLTADYTIKLIKHHISVYVSHTCFDIAKTGTNSYLAKILKLENIKFFDESVENSIGVYGNLSEEMSLKELTAYVNHKLNMSPSSSRTIGSLDKKIQKVGICTGAGMSELNTSIKLGCDVFITGDLKYHEALTVSENGHAVIDAGHFDTEKFFVDNMCKQLKNLFKDKVDIIPIKDVSSPFQNI